MSSRLAQALTATDSTPATGRCPGPNLVGPVANGVLVITHLFGEFLVNESVHKAEPIDPQPDGSDKPMPLLLMLNRVNLLRRAAQQGKAAEV